MTLETVKDQLLSAAAIIAIVAVAYAFDLPHVAFGPAAVKDVTPQPGETTRNAAPPPDRVPAGDRERADLPEQPTRTVAEQVRADQPIADQRRAFEQASKVERSLDVEQANAAGFDQDLSAARDQIAQVTRERDNGVAERQLLATALEQEQRRSAAFNDAAATAAQQVEALQQRLDTETAGASALDRDLSAVRAQLTEAEQRPPIEATKAADAELQDEQQRSASLADRLAKAQAADAKQAAALQQRLEGEAAKASSLDRDLSTARARLAEAEQRPSPETAKAADATLQAEQQRSAALADQLAEVRRAATRQAEVMQQRLDGATTKAASLDRDLSAARARLAEADQRPSIEAAKAADAKLQAEQQRSAALADQLAEARRAASRQAEAMQPRPDGEAAVDKTSATPRIADVTAQPVAVRAASPPATRAAETAQGQDKATSLEAAPPQNTLALPEGVRARVLLRYAQRNEAARQHATALSLSLRQQGLDVPEPLGVPAAIAVSAVSYFYGEDESEAAQIANTLAASPPVQRRWSAKEPLPRPGTIEVAIAG